MHKQITAASVALTSSQSADAGWHLLRFCRVTSTGARAVLLAAAAHGVLVGAHGSVEQSVCHALGVPVVQNGFLASLLDELLL
jgi:putative effector of murein hydrolase